MKRTRISLTVLLLAAAASGGPSAARGEDIEKLIRDSISRAVELRHQMHRNPELGNREFETAALVATELRSAGLEVTEGVAHTGVVGVLRGGRPGPVVALRADMDALPVTEETDLPFRSTKRGEYLGQDVGLAHACGHDVHTAVVLGAAKVLAEVRQELPGTVMFLFQPAEEGPPPGETGGAKLMLEEGVFGELRPQAIFGLHSWPGLTVGEVGYIEGPNMASVDHFVLRIRGQQAHGAAPHLSRDPVVMAAEVIQALQTIRSRTMSPLEPGVVTVGIVRGGERFNIIPAEVHLEGTVRTFSGEARALVRRRVEEILEGVTLAGGGKYEIVKYQSNAPALINDIELSRESRPILEDVVGAGNLVDLEPTMAGEDFAYFANLVPGFYFRLGIEDPETGSGALHTPTFRADDGAIAVGIEVMVALVLEKLGR
jgi:amidohydrolase